MTISYAHLKLKHGSILIPCWGLYKSGEDVAGQTGVAREAGALAGGVVALSSATALIRVEVAVTYGGKIHGLRLQIEAGDLGCASVTARLHVHSQRILVALHGVP